ncbi:hypothetical protein GCM10018966_011190 [Streptomyces yanii]
MGPIVRTIVLMASRTSMKGATSFVKRLRESIHKFTSGGTLSVASLGESNKGACGDHSRGARKCITRPSGSACVVTARDQ